MASQANIEHPWISKEFLEDLLRNNEKNDTISVIDHTVCLAVGKGDNYSSQLHRVNVTYKQGNVQKKCSLIVKSLPESANMRHFLLEAGIFEKELRLYEEILPALATLTRKTKCWAPLSPRHYHTSRPHTIIMADLKDQGYKMADRRRGLDLPHAVMAIRAMARLHAMSLALVKHDPKSMDQMEETFYTEEKRDSLKPMVETTFVALPKEVESWPNFERFGDKIRKVLNVDFLIKSASVKEGGLKVMNHGDFWLNNMLFRYDKSGDVADIRMVDFQLSRFSSPGLDIQYFIHTSLSMVVREMFVNKLLQDYHEEFCATLKVMGCDQVLTLRQLKDEVEEKLPFALLTACTVLPIVLAHSKNALDLDKWLEMDGSKSNEQQEQGNEKRAQDIAHAAGLNNIYSGAEFKKALQKMLIQFEKKGVFD